MNCTLCKNGETRPGNATVTLEREKTILIFKGVPADVCENCEEYYLTEPITEKLLTQAEQAARSGAEVEIFRFAA